MMEDEILKTGCLLKAGKHKIQSWRKRWFVIREDVITYYDSPQIHEQSHILGSIQMDQIRTVRISKEKKYSFDIETSGGRTYCLAAFSQTDRDDWLKVIREHSTLRRTVMDDFLFSSPSSDGVSYSTHVHPDPMWWNGKTQTLKSFAT